CVTGLSSHHIRETFQYSPNTMTNGAKKNYRCFKSMLVSFSLDTFYTSQIKFPTATTPVVGIILDDPQL
ncbi:hypothetical protein PAXRUDRAFT_144078, partial [Paxillus rubicundulus Ve08.2h10]